MTDEFVNDFLGRLGCDFTGAELSNIKLQLLLTLEDYEVAKKSTALVPHIRQFPEAYLAFMVAKKIEGMSKVTLTTYKMYLEHLFSCIDKDFKEITTNDIRLYLYKTQQERGLSNRSLDARRSCLSSFFGWANTEGYIGHNPMITIKPIKYDIKEVEPLSNYELEKVRMACKNKRERAIVETLYSTGCRVTELVRMNLSDIDFGDGNMGEAQVFGKGGKYRQVYLSSKAIIALQEWLTERNVGEDKDAVFTGERYPYRRLKRCGIEKIIRELGDRVGLHGLHPHQFRHTMATNCLQRGMELGQVSKMLGHVSLDTTTIYAKINTEDVKSNHKKFIG